MDTLEVRLFGGVSVRLNGTPLDAFPTRWSAGLFAYLALNRGRPTHRDVLAAQFWPEEPDRRARKGLRNALWRMKSTIEPKGVPPGSFLTVTGRSIFLNRERIWLDVEEFDGRMTLFRREVEEPARLSNLETCIHLYRGPFMEGHDHHWCTFERERLQLAFLTALERLLDFHMDHGEWRLAVRVGQQILGHDPLREHVHRCLMLCHSYLGNRPLAIRQFQECLEVLDREMGLPPMEVTRELHQQILAETMHRHSDPRDPGSRFLDWEADYVEPAANRKGA